MADRHNLCTNPALKNDNTGWGGGSTPTRTDVTGLGFVRNTAARYTSGTFSSTATGAVIPATEYTASVYIRPTNNSSGTLYIEWTLSSGGPSYTSEAYSATGGQVTRLDITGTAPALATAAGLVLDGVNYSFNTTDLTAVLIEAAATADTYFDGDTSGATWDGADGNSASTLSTTVTGTAAAALAFAASMTGVQLVTGYATAPLAFTAAASGTVTARAAGGWYGLRDTIYEAGYLAADERAAPPEACPNDGEPLRDGPDGALYCPFDGWRPDGSFVGGGV